MTHTFDALRSEYAALWTSMEVRPERKPEVNATARQIIANRPRYDDVSKATGVPWYLIGILHVMECDDFPRFGQHLHNGDSLKRRTVQVPAGRPKIGEPPFTWEASAIDALKMPGKQFDKITDWSIERIAYCLELYNGFGYRQKSINIHSPYLWSFTTNYRSGKYVRDHVWSASAVSTQCGALAILRCLVDLDTTIDLRSPEEKIRPWPAAVVVAEAAPSPLSVVETVKTASSSRTVWSLVIAAFAMLGDGVRWVIDRIADLFGAAPDIASDMQGMVDPIKGVLASLKLNAGTITVGVTVTCLIVAIIRHVEAKQGK